MRNNINVVLKYLQAQMSVRYPSRLNIQELNVTELQLPSTNALNVTERFNGMFDSPAMEKESAQIHKSVDIFRKLINFGGGTFEAIMEGLDLEFDAEQWVGMQNATAREAALPEERYQNVVFEGPSRFIKTEMMN